MALMRWALELLQAVKRIKRTGDGTLQIARYIPGLLGDTVAHIVQRIGHSVSLAIGSADEAVRGVVAEVDYGSVRRMDFCQIKERFILHEFIQYNTFILNES